MHLTRLVIPIVLAGAVASGAGPAGAAKAPDPLLGSWSLGGGKLNVSKSGSAFRGVASTPVKLGTCTFAPGTQVLRVTRFVRSSYGGTHTGDPTASPCGASTTGVANIWLYKKGTSQRGTLCVFPPDGSRRKRCYTMRRAS